MASSLLEETVDKLSMADLISLQRVIFIFRWGNSEFAYINRCSCPTADQAVPNLKTSAMPFPHHPPFQIRALSLSTEQRQTDINSIQIFHLHFLF